MDGLPNHSNILRKSRILSRLSIPEGVAHKTRVRVDCFSRGISSTRRNSPKAPQARRPCEVRLMEMRAARYEVEGLLYLAALVRYQIVNPE